MKRFLQWLSSLLPVRRRRWVMSGRGGDTWTTTATYTKEEAAARFTSKPIRPV